MSSLLTYPAVINPKPKVLVVHCIDPRFVVAFKKFISDMGIDENVDIVKKCAGGPMPLAHPQHMPSRFKWLKKQLEFTACEKFPSIEEFVGVMHEDCGYYHVAPSCCHRTDKERKDSYLIGNSLESNFPNKKVRMYYAKFQNGGTEISFEEVRNFSTVNYSIGLAS